MSGFRQAMTYTRLAAGTRVDGHWVEGAGVAATFYASKQPASGEDLQALPEGRRAGSVYALFTDTALRTADPENQVNADRVPIDGRDYEVLHVEPWQNGVLSHYKILVGRVNADLAAAGE